MNSNQMMEQPNRYFELTSSSVWRSEIGVIVKPLLDVPDRNLICIKGEGCLDQGDKIFIGSSSTFRPLSQKDQRKIEKELVRENANVSG